MYLCMNFIAMSAVVIATTWAAGSLDHLSTSTRMYAPLFSSTGKVLRNKPVHFRLVRLLVPFGKTFLFLKLGLNF